MGTEKQEQKKSRENPGRPKGTTRSREGHRRHLGMRLSPEAHRMIQEGPNYLPLSSTKTAFVEQAIIHYYQTLTQSSAADQTLKTLASGDQEHEAESENGMQPEGQSPPRFMSPVIPSMSLHKDEVQHAPAPSEPSVKHHDHIDEVLQAWKHVLPENIVAVIDIFGRLERVVKLLETDFEHLAVRHSITTSELFLIMALGRTAPSYSLAPRELVKSLLVTPGAITKQVDRLTALKLVERQLDTEDRRSVLVTLTPDGHQLFQAILTGTPTDLRSF